MALAKHNFYDGQVLTAAHLNSIEDNVSDEELMQLFMNAKVFVEKTGRRPDKNSNNEEEVRMAYALAKLSDMRARRNENR